MVHTFQDPLLTLMVSCRLVARSFIFRWNSVFLQYIVIWLTGAYFLKFENDTHSVKLVK